MFGKLFGKKDPLAGYDKAAAGALLLLEKAILHVHPEQFFNDEMEIAMTVQPCRVMANNVLGRPDTERFFPLEYEAFVARFVQLAQKKVLEDPMKLSAGDVVMNGLMRGIWHEFKLRHLLKQPHTKENLGYEVQASTKSLIDFLNRGATTNLEPMPGK